MSKNELLEGKRVLVVDDEPDVLETLDELLPMCHVVKASTFQEAEGLLGTQPFDLAIFDIMGVKGYDLLRIANKKGTPALMLTAHALSPENLVKSIKEGAQSYVPKDKLPEIALFIRDVLEERQKSGDKHSRWFARLKPFFDKQFGDGWREKDKEFWVKFESKAVVTKKDLEEMM